ALHAQTTATAPTTAAASTQPDESKTLAELQAVAKAKAEADAKGLPIAHFKKITDVVRLRLENDNLILGTTLTPCDESVVIIPGSPPLTQARRMNPPQAPDPTPLLVHSDSPRFDSPDAIHVQTTVRHVPGSL